RVAASLTALLNRVLVADRVDPADVDLVRETTARARDTLSLGLDRLSAGDVAAAVTLVERVPLSDVFQLGWSLVADLARPAHAPDRAGAIDRTLDPLLEGRPLFPCGLDPTPSAGARPFRAVDDLRIVETYLRGLQGD